MLDVASSVERVHDFDDWSDATKAVDQNLSIGAVIDAFEPPPLADIEIVPVFGRNRWTDFIAPDSVPEGMRRAARVAVANSGGVFFGSRGNLDYVSMFHGTDAELHHDDTKGTEIGSLVCTGVLKGSETVHLMRVPSFKQKEVDEVIRSYKKSVQTTDAEEREVVDLEAIKRDFTSVDLKEGEVLAFSGAGNKKRGRYPVIHYVESSDETRLAASIFDRTYGGLRLWLEELVENMPNYFRL